LLHGHAYAHCLLPIDSYIACKSIQLKAGYYIFYIFFLAALEPVSAQVLGGESAYNFLKLPPTPQLSALGGINISNRTNDIGVTMWNASFLRADMSGQIHASFNSMYAGIKNVALVAGHYVDSWKTNVGLGISYVDYGTIDATDPSGNMLGTLHPRDYLIRAMVSRQYETKWHYGFAMNFIQSSYGEFQSSALALDATATYYDSSRGLQAALVLKNMGAQLKSFVPGHTEQVPFDFQIGVSKRLEKAPIQFSLTAHHLHQFDIRYNDTTFNNDNGFEPANSNNHFTFDKIFRHFVIATQIYIGDYLEVSLGYNHLRRQELNIGNSGNGLNGFSVEVGALFKKIQIRYARAYYQNNTAYNQFGLNLSLNKYFGLSKFGERIGW